MKIATVAIGAMLVLAGCTSAPSGSAVNDPSAVLVSVEARAGVADRAKEAQRVAGSGPESVIGGYASLGYRPGSCCGFEAFIGRSYLANGGQVRDLRAGELTDIGLGFAARFSQADFWERWRVRTRLGLTGVPPIDQDLMRRGVTGDLALLIRLFPSDPKVTVGSFSPHVDFLLGAQGWALGRRRTTYGTDGNPETVFAITVGLQLTLEHGVDFR